MLPALRSRIILALTVFALALLSCNLPSRAAQTTTAAATPGDLNDPVSHLSEAALSLEDLPSGFIQLSEEEMEELGFSREQIAENFSGMLSRAQPQNYTAFTKVDPPNFQVVLSTVLAPITTLERVAVDVYLSNPDQVAENFASGTGAAQVDILPDTTRIGSKSIGLTYLNLANETPMRTDTVISRQENAIQVAIVIHPEGTEPDIRAREVAQIIEAKIAASAE